MLKKRKPSFNGVLVHFIFSNACVLLSLFDLVVAGVTLSSQPPSTPPRLPSLLPGDGDGYALLAFKSKADLWNKLDFSNKTIARFCQWRGVTCYQNRVVRLVIEDVYLGGQIGSDSLSRLDELRVLSLQNNSLTGILPDLSGLVRIRSMFLDRNSFSGKFPVSVLSLHRLKTLDLSFNRLTGTLPASLASLERLYYLRLDSNRFIGSIPPLNQTSLQTFNVSSNNLTGAVPVTDALLRFGFSSFAMNPYLCGEIVKRECHYRSVFFGPTTAEPPASPPETALRQSAHVNGGDSIRPVKNKHSKTAVILGLGFSSCVFVLIISMICFIIVAKRHKSSSLNEKKPKSTADIDSFTAAIQVEQEHELEEKVKRAQEEMQAKTKSGSLLFCAGEAQLYTLEQLMRGSAELLGRGTMGTTYKAVLDNRLIVCVKRLDAGRLAGVNKEVYERHMESVGGLRHPNLVPLRAYFQAKEERLLIYDYQPNGSLFSLVHGTKSTRAKPLHWTSCLKIAEDIAQGISYIHQAWRLVHGNIKSSNILLGPDFEACVADYCLSALATNPPSQDELDPDAASYKAPETRTPNFDHQTSTTPKSDVYSFGILLLELLTGKPPSQLPSLVAEQMVNWVKSIREEDSNDSEKLGMLSEVAIACSLCSPEQRPTMWQVLKMLQEIKEAVVMEDDDNDDELNLDGAMS